MTNSSSLGEGHIVKGSLSGDPMRVVTVQPKGDALWKMGLVALNPERFQQVMLNVQDLP